MSMQDDSSVRLDQARCHFLGMSYPLVEVDRLILLQDLV